MAQYGKVRTFHVGERVRSKGRHASTGTIKGTGVDRSGARLYSVLWDEFTNGLTYTYHGDSLMPVSRSHADQKGTAMLSSDKNLSDAAAKAEAAAKALEEFGSALPAERTAYDPPCSFGGLTMAGIHLHAELRAFAEWAKRQSTKDGAALGYYADGEPV